MSNKVIGGTPVGSHSLCLTCRQAQHVIGLNKQDVIYCRARGNQSVPVLFPVAECSVYDDKRVPSLYMMEQVAWNVTSRHRGPTGFAQEAVTEIHIEPPEPRGPNSAPQPTTGKGSD